PPVCPTLGGRPHPPQKLSTPSVGSAPAAASQNPRPRPGRHETQPISRDTDEISYESAEIGCLCRWAAGPPGGRAAGPPWLARRRPRPSRRHRVGSMTGRSILLFALAALLEIGGAWLV